MGMFGFQDRHVHSGWNHFACSETRLVLQGSLHVCALDPLKVPGDSYKDKRTYLYSFTVDSLAALVKQGGFYGLVDSSQYVCFPSGFLVVVAAETKCVGLRWSLSSDDKDTSRVSSDLKMLLTSFPEMKSSGTGYHQFLQFIDSMRG